MGHGMEATILAYLLDRQRRRLKQLTCTFYPYFLHKIYKCPPRALLEISAKGRHAHRDQRSNVFEVNPFAQSFADIGLYPIQRFLASQLDTRGYRLVD